jgi:hypothetical protein
MNLRTSYVTQIKRPDISCWVTKTGNSKCIVRTQLICWMRAAKKKGKEHEKTWQDRKITRREAEQNRILCHFFSAENDDDDDMIRDDVIFEAGD